MYMYSNSIGSGRGRGRGRGRGSSAGAGAAARITAGRLLDQAGEEARQGLVVRLFVPRGGRGGFLLLGAAGLSLL